MIPKKIVLTGATGFLGKRLYKALVKRGDDVTIFTSSMVKGVQRLPGADEFIEWDYKRQNHWQEHINGKDAVIHLAGANLTGKRWTKDYKKTIIESRQISTANLVNAISKAVKKPEVFICASGVGYYGNKGNQPVTEEDKPGNDFLAEVCKIWEHEASKAEQLGVRWVSIRTGVVLAKEEGALKKMMTPYKFFAGGPLGSGKQWFPWIHVDDIINAYLFALDNNLISGPVNAAAPQYVRMKDFARTLGKVLKRPWFFPVPKFVLKIVAGESADAVVTSQKIIPQKLFDFGFIFRYEKLEDALKNLMRKNIKTLNSFLVGFNFYVITSCFNI